MKNLYTLHERAEREIELIEEDDSLTDNEKREIIKEIYQELQNAEEEYNN